MNRWQEGCRYGLLIMEVEKGRWFWSQAMRCISFVPSGRQLASYQYSLSAYGNTKDTAIYHAARMIRAPERYGNP